MTRCVLWMFWLLGGREVRGDSRPPPGAVMGGIGFETEAGGHGSLSPTW